MKKIYIILSVLTLSFLTFNCSEHDPSVDAPKSLSFLRAAEIVNFDPDSPVFPLTVYSTQTSTEDRVVNLTIPQGINPLTNTPYTTAIDGDFTVATSVIIPAGELSGSTNLTFNPDNIALGVSRTVSFEIVSPDDSYFLNKTSNITTITYSPLCPFNLISFDLILDRYGDEISWQITDAGGNIVAADGPFENSGVNALQAVKNYKYCLPDGDYVFEIYDIYGDGLFTSAAVQGSYKISLDGTVLFQGGGNFGASSAHPFTL